MRWRLIWAGVAFAIALLPCVAAQFAGKGRWSIGVSGYIIVLTVVYTIYNTIVSFRLQEFMNENVGRALR
jgi:hypothetical protein